MNILNVEKVSKTYGEKELFNNISLGINSGDKIGLIGVNGTGKSTLLNAFIGKKINKTLNKFIHFLFYFLEHEHKGTICRRISGVFSLF